MFDWKDKMLQRGVIGIFKYNLCVNKSDKVFILSDTHKERVGELLFYFGSRFTSYMSHFTYKPTGRHGLEPPEEVWRAVFGTDFLEEVKRRGLLKKILDKKLSEEDEFEVKEILLETTAPEDLPTVVIAINQYSISHTVFRKLCTGFLSIRFASMPLFEPFMFYTSLQANWNLVARRSVEIASLLTDADGVRVTCPKGTDITFSIKGRNGLADTGKICSPGDFGNLPAGEAFIAPLEGTASGKFVTSYAPNRRLREPVVLEVDDGSVKRISGEKEFSDFLSRLIENESQAGNIAEFGVGTNEKAKRFDNVLEAEKILGTCHIAIGDNSSFGGKVRANVHIDLLIEKPTIVLDLGGKSIKLMEEGELLLKPASDN